MKTENQPITFQNMLHYLVTCLATPATIGTLDNVLSYRALMRVMAEERGTGGMPPTGSGRCGVSSTASWEDPVSGGAGGPRGMLAGIGRGAQARERHASRP
jgi:hypothetical protein